MAHIEHRQEFQRNTQQLTIYDSFQHKHKLKTTYKNKHNKKETNLSHTCTNNNYSQCTPFYTSQSLYCQQVFQTTFTSTQTSETFIVFHQITYHSNYVIYLLECVMCKIQYAEKSETSNNIRINNHR